MPTSSLKGLGITSLMRRAKIRMKISEEWLKLFEEFNKNWAANRPELAFSGDKEKWIESEDHQFISELKGICQGNGGSLPYFTNQSITWCSLAISPIQLKQQVESLNAWIIPSYGWTGTGDGYLEVNPKGKGIHPFLYKCSPHGYFRWSSSLVSFQIICSRFNTWRKLLEKKPKRKRTPILSLFELRSSFQIALLSGNPEEANSIIDKIDQESLDSASNTQMMRIRLWHKFREFEKIKNFKNLDEIQSLSSLPKSIELCINEALGKEESNTPFPEKEDEEIKEDIPSDRTQETILDTSNEVLASNPPHTVLSWTDWFDLVTSETADTISNEIAVSSWLDEKEKIHPDTLNSFSIKKYTDSWETLFLNEKLVNNYRAFFNEALGKFIEDYVQGDHLFPRSNFVELYLSLMRNWGQLRGGQGGNHEAGHVLLELGRALLQFNHSATEVKSIIENWWSVRPTPALLPFALDAIDLLHIEHPDKKASENLWVGASDIAKRNPDTISNSEKVLWRKVGLTIGLDEEVIDEYFPISKSPEVIDPLKNSGLKKVSIVCMRETQAKEAKKIIEERSDIDVSIISSKVAGSNTTQARSCDVVLFVWLAASHAVFRAFDGFNRDKLCYVQGTGVSSIVRSLERWIKDHQDSPGDVEAA